MDNLAIIFIYSHKDLLTSINYGSIQKYARDAPIYAIHQNDFPNSYYNFLDYQHISEWRGYDIWYWGSDNIFLYWYLTNPDKRAKNYLILEYDTYASEDIRDFFNLDDTLLDSHHGVSSALTIFAKTYGYGYWWFDAQRHLPLINKFYGADNFAACSPLCSTLISDDATSSLIEHLKEYPQSNKLYVETKFATILKYLKYNVLNHNNSKNVNLPKFISYERQICIDNIRTLAPNPGDMVKSGVHHPIKDTQTLWRYFMTSDTLDIKEIDRAYFGSIYDAKIAIETLQKAGVRRIMADNTLCGDPAPGLNKQLYLQYEKDGQILNKIFHENEIIDLYTL
jgi:hypothetical protein